MQKQTEASYTSRTSCGNNFSWFGFAYTRSWEVAKFLNYRYVKDGVKQTFFLFHSRFPLETRRFSVEREGKRKPARKGNKATSLYMVVVLKARSLWSRVHENII